VLPDVERCLDMVKMLLGLKTTHRGKPIVLRMARTRGQSVGSDQRSGLEGKSYLHAELDTLLDDIRSGNIVRCQIAFEFAPPDRLYPNVKAEIIQMLREISGKHSGARPAVFVDPCFDLWINTHGEIGLFLDDIARSGIQQHECVTETRFAAMERGAPSAALDVWMPLDT
jgi:hypothetical protein